MDDAHATGPDSALLWLVDTMRERGVNVKSSGILGVGAQYTFLKRVYTRTPHGFVIEPNRSTPS